MDAAIDQGPGATPSGVLERSGLDSAMSDQADSRPWGGSAAVLTTVLAACAVPAASCIRPELSHAVPADPVFVQSLDDTAEGWRRLRAPLLLLKGRILHPGEADPLTREFLHALGLHSVRGAVRHPGVCGSQRPDRPPADRARRIRMHGLDGGPDRTLTTRVRRRQGPTSGL
jgi:hypothetical protein